MTRPPSVNLLTRKEAAALLRTSPITLARWDADGRHGIPHIRIGGRIFYRLEDLEAFLDRNLELREGRGPAGFGDEVLSCAGHRLWSQANDAEGVRRILALRRPPVWCRPARS